MPIVPLQNCQPTDDLTVTLQALEQQIGSVTQSILNDISQLDNDTSGITAAQILLNNLSQQAPIPQTADATAESIGIPVTNADQQQQEERLEELGLILINGILYLAGSNSNIEILRQLFFSLGSNMALFLEQVGSSVPFIVTQTNLVIEPLAPTQTWTVEQARAALNNPFIEEIYTAADGNNYVVLINFLAVNESAASVAQRFSISEEEIITRVFWLNTSNPDMANLNKLQLLGISGEQQVATIAGGTIEAAAPSVITSTKTQTGILTGTAVSQVQLFNSRFLKIDQNSKNVFVNEITTSINAAIQSVQTLEQQVRFSSLVITNPSDIASFLVNNSQADLTYLFSDRRSVTSINFQATPTQLIAGITQAISVSSGSTTLSAIQVNSHPVAVDPNIHQANLVYVELNSALLQMEAAPFKYPNLQVAYACLQASLSQAAATTTAPSSVPQIGYLSYDSPASILARQVNFTATLNTNGLTNAISAAFASTSLVNFVKALTAALTSMQQAITKAISSLQSKIASFSTQLEGFLSRYMSFFGTASLNSSILKCSLGFNIQTSLPVLNELTSLINLLARKLNNIIATIAQTISNFITKLLCMPINLLNGFITGVTSGLPSFCALAKVTLPTALNAALIQLRNSFMIQSNIFQAYGRDLLRVKITTQSLPAKLSNFGQSLSCESPANGAFFSAASTSATTALGVGSSVNVVGAAGTSLQGFGA